MTIIGTINSIRYIGTKEPFKNISEGEESLALFQHTVNFVNPEQYSVNNR